MGFTWPWRGDQTSAESFEKTLSALATKVSKTSTRHDQLRQRARRLKVSWTLYGGFTYILAFLILTLVTGWRNWGAVEYTAVAGGPPLLYGVRYLLTAWYNYRITSAQEYLDSLLAERDATLEKLKQATKYNSTQQLLDKYGSVKPKKPEGSPKSDKKKPRTSDARVFASPPPTANIPRNHQLPSTPSRQPASSAPNSPAQNLAVHPASPAPGEEFAPNAHDFPQQVGGAPPVFGEPKWYDRILDALLGDDETQAKNRFVLLCTNCRLVNGLAPPGAKTLEEVGKWRCYGCGTLNGQELDAAKLVKDIETKESVKVTPDPGEKESKEEDEKIETSAQAKTKI